MKKNCLYNNKGWWTYEVCFGKGIYQYHKEGQEVVGEKITLGVFSNETDWSQEKIDVKEKPKPGKRNVVKRFHSQYYMNGSECDLTGKARETQIKIYCDEGIADVVLRVDEPLSCSYVVTVHTNKLCQHSLFRPNPSQKLQAITCSPALSEERYKIYIERIESRKKAKEEAEAAKYRTEKARAAKKIESEDELLEQDEEESSTKKKRSKRSQVWPWENPGVESEDEVWIDGNIKPDEIGVHRLDITKGRKKNADGFHESEGITIMSQKMQRKRELEDQRQKGETEGNLEEMSEHEQGQEQTEQAEKTVETENIEGAGNNEEGDGEATEQINEQETKEKQATSEVEENEKATESSGTPNGASEKIEKESSESEKGLDDEWRTKMEETVLKLRSTLKEKLVKLGIKPEVLDQKFTEKLGSVTGKGSEKDHTGKDDKEIDKQEERDTNVLPETDQLEQTTKKDAFTKTIEEMKILNDGMMKELMDAASATQAEIEKQFDVERAQMKTAVEQMKNKIKEIEETEEKNGVKDGLLGETMSKIKDSIERFEKTNMQLDEDMLSVKELNKEIFRTIEDKETTAAKGDLLQLSSKTKKLVKKILLRRFQLEQDLHYLKKMQSKISADEQNTHSTDKTGFSATTGVIDQVVNKLKAMIQDLDTTEARPEAGAGAAAEDTADSIEPGSSTAATAEDEDTASKSGLFDQGDMRTGVKVKVSKIKKITVPDDDESELEETDLDEEEMEELNMDKRIRLATKKMEEMVKQELRDSGVVPSGKIRVKIVTSKDALESLDSKSDVRLLSDKEETQFKDMILGLLGGSPEAGKERKRQQDLENNYNLVWSDDELQTVPREDDDTDGEVEVESF